MNDIIRDIKEFFNPPKRICNLCNSRFDKFSPLDSMYREMKIKYGYPYSPYDAETLNVDEYSCPSCHSSDRDRLYALFFKTKVGTEKKYKLLDIAPSAGLVAYLKGMPNIIRRSADLFMEGVDDKVDIMNMEIYQENTFDIFICSHVLEHVPDDRKAMAELYRVLKPGGFGIAMVPIQLPVTQIDEEPTLTDPIERWRRFGQDDHVRLYSKAGFKERLVEAGFNIKEYSIADFSSKSFEKYGIHPRSILYIVSK